MTTTNNDIAVIGMAGVFPGADNITTLWRNLCDGKDCLRTFSDSELRDAGVSEADIQADNYVKAGYTLDDVDMFDPAFFKIPPVDAELMDPQIRLFLQCAWKTLEDAGHATRDPQNIGVFAGMGGVTTNYFSSFINLNSQFEKITASKTHTGNDKDFIATFISYKLNLTGPSVSVQTACSTSLVAVHQACASILNRECDMALAGGANIRIPHNQGYRYTRGNIYSKSGRIRSFDKRADGVVFGSGVGLVLLKKLDDAVRDGNHIYAVVKGSAISNDGRDKLSYTATNVNGQFMSIDKALNNARVDAGTIGFIESHGTGTYMGDPIEISALSKAFYKNTKQADKRNFCALGAVKTSIGHLDVASGITGFIKTALVLHHKLIPPTLHFETPNPRISFDTTPFYINSAPVKLKQKGQPLRAGVNSVGVGGTNAFVVMEEYLPAAKSIQGRATSPADPVIVPISAKTIDSLQRYVSDLLEFIETHPGARPKSNLADLAYTLQIGREAMDYRVAYIASSFKQLAGQLAAFVNGEEDALRNIVRADVRDKRRTADVSGELEETQVEISHCIKKKQWIKLAELWRRGGDVDWDALYGRNKPGRISLPTYSFEKERYWIEAGDRQPENMPNTALHPLLHHNTSDLSRQSYSVTFHGREFFLKDHQVQGQSILPGVAFLEMARAAIEKSVPAPPPSSILELCNIVWMQPILVDKTKQVNIALFAADGDNPQDRNIDYEIYEHTKDKDVVYCQGRAVFRPAAGNTRLDIDRLKEQMRRGAVDAAAIYPAFSKMGLEYGPAHQGITTLFKGEQQALAQLRLPAVVQNGLNDFVLHPSLIDGALQASIGLMEDFTNLPDQPPMPFTLRSVRILSGCTGKMYAWVRYSKENRPGDKIIRMDIDLCDSEGNVCVQMREFSSRLPRNNAAAGNGRVHRTGALLAAPVWEPIPLDPQKDRPLEPARHVLLCASTAKYAEQLRGLMPDQQCIPLQIRSKTLAGRYRDMALACFEHLQTLLQSKPRHRVLVQLVVADTPEETLFAGLSGLLKSATLENPRLIGQTILIQPGMAPDRLAAQLLENQVRLQDSIIKCTPSGRYVLRWREKDFTPEIPKIAFKDQGVYLITGGLGGLGRLFAKEIMEQTKGSRIILTGRGKITAEKKSALEALSAGSGRLIYKQLDLDDLDRVRRVVAEVVKEYGQLNGIIHSAGMFADNFILNKSADEFARVLTPKIIGAQHLDQAGKDVDLDFLVLFSSTTSIIGNLGQADYAAANGFLDQFAGYRNQLAAEKQRRGQTLSINWPLWKDGGMRMDPRSLETLHDTTGLQPMQTATGIQSFHRALQMQSPRILVAEGDLLQIRQRFIAAEPRPAEPATIETTLAADVDPTGLLEKTQEYLRRRFSTLLKIPLHKISPQAPLEEYGIDSLLAINLTNELEKTFGNLSKTLFFEYQSIGELTEYFIEAHAPQVAHLFADPAAGPEPKTPAPLPASSPGPFIRSAANDRKRFSSPSFPSVGMQTPLINAEPVAIVGLSGRYPEAVNIDQYWNNLREGKDCIIEVPKERWDWREYYSGDRTQTGHHNSKWGGFIEGVDEFDPRFFNISPKEAETIDPQERLFLQHAWMAVEDAGYTRASLQIPHENDLPGQVGVYAGVMWGEYPLFGAQAAVLGKRMAFAGNLASIANRVSYVLNVHGPSLTLDTMCSSSLTAVHAACQDLKQGRIDLAIAGGVNISIHPNKYLMLSDGQFISGDGHCQSFGEGGDGYIPGEGVGVVILKRLSEAQRDKNHIYGIIKASALNHGGKTNGYTVPNPQAQTSVILRAFAESGTDPRHISYIEAHGTGTKLGDPIEIAALNKAFRRFTQDNQFCLIGSAKSNIGHCESAAGVAGLTKVLLQMKYKQIVPSLHAEKLNPHIDFEKTPFIVNQTLKTWDPPVVDGVTPPRIAGISSFGAGGSNAHLIVQEYIPSRQEERPVVTIGERSEFIIPLSARTAEQLRQKAIDLLEHIRGPAREKHRKEQPASDVQTVSLPSLAYTLQVGREAMGERLGVLVGNVEQLVEKLQAYIDGRQDIDDLYQGQVKRNKEGMRIISQDEDMQEAIDKWIANRKFSKLLDLWVKGLELDWRKLYGDTIQPRISLPAYPFAKERYWVDVAQPDASADTVTTTVLHPLMHRNTSDFSRQSYSAAFTGREFFLADHTLKGIDGAVQKALPFVAYFEMARFAVEDAVSVQQEAYTLELHNTVWARPALPLEDTPVSIALFAKGPELVDYEIYSRNHEEETVHCQGHAVFSRQTPPARLEITHLKAQMQPDTPDPGGIYSAFANMGIHYGPAYQCVTAIHRGEKQLLAELTLPETTADDGGHYILHPGMMCGAIQACAGLAEEFSSDANALFMPTAVESLRIISRFSKRMLAWVRYAAGHQPGRERIRLDMDLCDLQGNVHAQMRGIQYERSLSEPVAAHNSASTASFVAVPAAPAAPAPEKIALPAPRLRELVQAAPHKPSRIVLVEPGNPAFEKADRRPLPKPVFTLSDTASIAAGIRRSPQAGPESVSLFDHGNGMLSLQIAAPDGDNKLTRELITQIVQALKAARDVASAKVLVISGTARCFLIGARKHHNEAVRQELYQAIISFPYPVIAAMQGDAAGPGFLVAALCDFMVCSQEARYSFTDPREGIFPTAEEAHLFQERFGRPIATDFLYCSAACTGRSLLEKGWQCPVVAGSQVQAHARELAANLARKSQEALALLKRHLARPIRRLTAKLSPVQPVAGPGQPDAVAKAVTSPCEHVRLDTHADHTLVITLRPGRQGRDITSILFDLGAVLSQVGAAGRYKSIVLASEHPGFIPGTGQGDWVRHVMDLQGRILDASLPVIAVLDTGTTGAGWYIGQFCDACVHDEKGDYSSADIRRHPELAHNGAAIFALRCGKDLGREIVLTGKTYTGAELRERNRSLMVAGHGQALDQALELAERWAGMPYDRIAAWKKEMAADIRRQLENLPARPASKQTHAPQIVAAATPVELDSEVVSATVYPDGILLIRMEDRRTKNLFSPEFERGMHDVFQNIAKSRDYKVVILTGYDTYFASGGTKETLLAIQEGKTRFTDSNVYQLALDCKVPVIAAMQGHGIGAGWCLGMFADVILFSNESKYLSPYMAYGFTPGAGATYIIPEEMGNDLARETLLTGREYSGRELKDRGLPNSVLPREQVLSAAFALAGQMADLSIEDLMALKHQFTCRRQEALAETYGHELEMHARTFVGRPEILHNIHAEFDHQENASRPAAAPNIPMVEPPAPAAGPPASIVVTGDVAAAVRTLLAQELRLQEHEIDEDTQFVDLGLDSITGVTWVRRINEQYKTSIEATKVYSYPTLAQLSRYVAEEAQKAGVQLDAPEKAESAPAPVSAPASAVATPLFNYASLQPARRLASWRGTSHSKWAYAASATPPAGPIAVVGMAGRFPMAKNLDAFWQNISQGKNCIREIPAERWDINTWYTEGKAVAGKTNCKWMGCLDEYDLFDPLFFNISPKEAKSMDPQQRLFLEACWHGIEHAGYNPHSLSGSKCGVFVGCGTGDYNQLSRDQQLSAQGFIGSAVAVVAARIAYFLNLQGPCISIETACSSSLVAIANACDSLNSGGSDLALAGGVNVMATPDMHIKSSQAGMLSPDGRCHTFDQRANGFVPGEGLGVVMLKRLADAEKDHDAIYGVIQGWGINQDGRTNGITAPKAESQTRLQQEVYDRFNIDPAEIQLIEAHGTATKLGDPIEVAALKEAFQKYTDKKDYCALGSVKSNIGHCLTAAGIAGFLKLILALKHKQLPPTINFSRLNEHIRLEDSPFYINHRLQAWDLKDSRKRQAAVSSFGFSGTNVHIVVSEYADRTVKPPVSAPARNSETIIVLSARTPDQLNQKARDLLNYIQNDAEPPDLAAMGYTLQVGREAMDERLGFLVNSTGQLVRRLEAYVDGQENIEACYRGQVKHDKESMRIITQDAEMKEALIEKWVARDNLPKLLELWVKGLDLDWNRLYGEAKPQRISLPAYPFARERYWLDAVDDRQAPTAGKTGLALHPLVHANTSDLRQQSFSSTFSGQEPFIKDHQMALGQSPAQKIFPAMACLEMARAAVSLARPGVREPAMLAFHDMRWSRPVAINEPRPITIALFAGDDEQVDYEIYSREDDQEIVHHQGRVVLEKTSSPPKHDLDRLKGRMQPGPQTSADIYANFVRMGLEYGPTHQGIASLYQGENQLLAQLRWPAGVDAPADAYQLHPGVMESALQAAMVLATGFNPQSNPPANPFSLETLRIFCACPKETIAWVRLDRPRAPQDGLAQLDIDLCDLQGNVCVQMHGLSLQQNGAEQDIPAVPADMPVEEPEPAVSREQLQQQLKNGLAEALFLNAADVDFDTQFIDLGLDSIIGVEWVSAINKQYGTDILATTLYQYPTITKLASMLAEELKKASSDAAPPDVSLSKPVVSADRPEALQNNTLFKRAGEKLESWHTRRPSRISSGASSASFAQPIAVIGMAGRFPRANDLDAYWRNIATGENCITEIPPDRWDIDSYYRQGEPVPGKTYCRHMGVLEDHDRFDPLFFNISPTEAVSMDPQQRLFLQTCWHTIEDAGYSAQSLSGSRCGVFVGCVTGDYLQLSREHQLSAQGFTGGAVSILAARISYLLNLQGPCISIDTACSSSLVAIADACDSLISGSSDLALAGGVCVLSGPDMHIMTSQAGMLSPDGRCYTFDRRANGFVPGEGVGMVMLKRLADAERDRDMIHGVIQGWGVNQDGKTNGITAPNSESQTRLMQEIYDKFRIDPARIQLIETHGTGTRLGDPIEIEGLKASFKKYTQNKSYCALGSVKSNIGHCLAAAGIAGFIKLILAMKSRQLPPTINFKQLNDQIVIKDGPFYINDQLQEWKPDADGRRQAAISAFGFSGTNAHVVVAEYPHGQVETPVPAGMPNAGVIIPLSANTQAQLQQKARDLLDFIDRPAHAIDLVEMAYTLQVGRQAMDERLGFLVRSAEQLTAKLRAYLDGASHVEEIYQGRVQSSREALAVLSGDDDMQKLVEQWIARQKHSRIADLWVKGLQVDWNKFYGDIKPGRMRLPVYPFARERYWIDTRTPGKPTTEIQAPASMLHPLVHSNVSDLIRQSYSATFSGDEFFLKDHRIQGRKVLPGVACLEMARAAVEKAVPQDARAGILSLNNIVWIQPIAVARSKQVRIALFVQDADDQTLDRVAYEIYSEDDGQEVLHCQGMAVYNGRSVPARLDIDRLMQQMELGRWENAGVYSGFARMGLEYGPAHRGIAAIHRGDRQVLARLHLPVTVEKSMEAYLLHPSLMDSALQSAIGLMGDLSQIPNRPSLPFAMDALHIFSACTREMFAWVRYSKGCGPGDKLMKLDVDLCDPSGNVCVQMHGFTSRAVNGEFKDKQPIPPGNVLDQETNRIENDSAFNEAYYQELIEGVMNKRVSVNQAVKLG